MVKVKICGIRSLEEALWAVEAGADALGFVFHPLSKRSLEPEAARAIITELPPFIARVGVFVDKPWHEVEDIARECGLTAIQLHGKERPEDYKGIRLPIIKALAPEDNSLTDGTFVNALSEWKNVVQAVLMDSVQAGQFGGTGNMLAWEQPTVQSSVEMVKQSGLPLILAGGLKPENVSHGIKSVHPYAVDVSSGVEREGRKDRELIQAFIYAAKNSNSI